MIHPIIADNISKISEICKNYKVKELYAFGSVTDDKRFNDKSDLDFIVRFFPMPVEDYADLYFALAEDLEKLLDRSVDLMMEKPILNPFLKESIEESKKIIYHAAA